MTVWKGGRGVKAPYETTNVRIPVPVKEQVESLANRYRETLELDAELPSIESAIAEARKILVQKKSARASLERLLTQLYRQPVTLTE